MVEWQGKLWESLILRHNDHMWSKSWFKFGGEVGAARQLG